MSCKETKTRVAVAADIYDKTSTQQGNIGLELIEEFSPPITKGSIVLDLGCGTGYLSSVLSEVVGPEGKVVAVDPDKDRISLAVERYGKLLSNVVFIEANDQTFPDGQYDVIFLSSVIHWIEDKLSFLNRAYRYLRPGGKLAFSTTDGIEQMTPNQLYRDFYHTLLGPNFMSLVERKFFPRNRSVYEELASDCGFQVTSLNEKIITRKWSDSWDGMINNIAGMLQGDFDRSWVDEKTLDRFREIPYEPPQMKELFVILTKPSCIPGQSC